MQWPGGKYYDGDYVDDNKEGVGEFHWPDGKWYKGDWVKGQQHGQGLYYAGTGDQ